MMNIIYAFIAVLFVSAISLVGVMLLLLKRPVLSRIMPLLLAVSSGVMLGNTFFDLIPESVEHLSQSAYLYILAGIIVFFSVEKMLNWHHHTEGDHPGETKSAGYLSLIGDAIHNFIDGVLIGGAFIVSIPLGITVAVAVTAHEIPHELADFTILIHCGFSNRKALFYNFLSASTAIAGTCVVILFAAVEKSFVPYLIPFAAGNFLYIAMSDLIPELHKSRSRMSSIIQIFALIAGAVAISLLPGHD